MSPQLLWRPNRRFPLASELAAAVARFRERTGQPATQITVAIGERIEAGPELLVLESIAVARGCWYVGGRD